MNRLDKEKYSKAVGIYVIKNKINGKRYFGSSVTLYRRINQHIALLLRNTHHNRHLQSSVNKYGLHNFELFIHEQFENIDEKELRVKEGRLILKNKTHLDEFGYNLDIDDENGIRKHSQRARENVSKSRKLAPIISYNATTGQLVEYDAPRFVSGTNSQKLLERIKTRTVLLDCYWFYQNNFNLRELKTSVTNQTTRVLPQSIELLDTETGIFYMTLREAAQANELSSAAFKARIRKGYYATRFTILSEDKHTSKKMVLHLPTGVYYDSMTAAARFNSGINANQLCTYLRHGNHFSNALYLDYKLC